MARYSFLVRLSHPLLHAGLSRRLLDYLIYPPFDEQPFCPFIKGWTFG